MEAPPTMDLFRTMPDSWRRLVVSEMTDVEKAAAAALARFLATVDPDVVVPRQDLWFAALDGITPRDVGVIILGQDPYPNPKDAVGASFAVSKDTPLPRSLINIMKVARASVDREKGTEGVAWPMDRTLSHWRAQGVLLLNCCLTTEAGKRNAHARKGWEAVTSAIMRVAARESPHVIALLWGNEAHKHSDDMRKAGCEILRSSHPSPLGWGRSGRHGSFKESLCFYHVNQRRAMKQLPRIAWEVVAE